MELPFSFFTLHEQLRENVIPVVSFLLIVLGRLETEHGPNGWDDLTASVSTASFPEQEGKFNSKIIISDAAFVALHISLTFTQITLHE
jgi:hypothetical protein